jgi:hypothetical protein
LHEHVEDLGTKFLDGSCGGLRNILFSREGSLGELLNSLMRCVGQVIVVVSNEVWMYQDERMGEAP